MILNVIGGNFASRINSNLRQTKGWTYGAGTSFFGNKYTGTYTFSSGIRADATDAALLSSCGNGTTTPRAASRIRN